jgi:Fe-S cluster assembly protein SufB
MQQIAQQAINKTLIQDHKESDIFNPAPERWLYRTKPGLSKDVVEEISYQKCEPLWMRQKRLNAFEIFESKKMPSWGPDLSKLNFDNITFYIKPEDVQYNSWDKVPSDIKSVYDALGIPEAEKKMLAGVVGQYESEGFYNKLKTEWEEKGVIFCDTDTALKKYPDLLKEYFMTKCVPIHDHKFAALHGAVWSGGSFLYVPKGVIVDLPLQTYFRMNAKNYGQFEHTLIIVEPGASVQYIEACTAPRYNSASLHSAVVEIFVKEGAKARYTTMQNWSTDVYNLNTKRAIVEKNGVMEWVGGSLGSSVTMLYPASWLIGENAKASHLNIAIAGENQHKDTGAKVVHGAPNTSSTILSKSISFGGGRTTYRGLVKINKGAKSSRTHVQCDALILDAKSRSDTIPYMEIYEDDTSVAHEARVGRISDEQMFYLKSRGLSENDALALIVNGFIDPIANELPLEYAVELNRLIAMELEGKVG